MKKYFLFLTVIYFITLIAGCSKSTTGPPDCHIGFKIRFFDKDTGDDLGVSGTSFLDSVKITSYTNWGQGYSSIGWDRDIQVVFENGIKYFTFSSSGFDFCDEDIYLTAKENKYIIEYAEGVSSDSIILLIDGENSNHIITYTLNDSVIGYLDRAEFRSSSRKNLPVISIKK